MVPTVIDIYMEEDLKREFEDICMELGMDAATAFNVFVRTVVRERKIPFEIRAEISKSYGEDRREFTKRREELEVVNSRSSDMRVEEINERIRAASLAWRF